MKLDYFKIEGFRRHVCTEIHFSDSTFLIGENNIGKSSVLRALDYLLRDEKKIPESEFFCYKDEKDVSRRVEKITLTAEFREIPSEALNWRGFKGRVLKDDRGLKIVYRKIFKPNTNYIVELEQYSRIKKDAFKNCKTFEDYINAGISEEVLKNCIDNFKRDSKVVGAQKTKLFQEIDELYEFKDEKEWFENPGGIPGVVLSKLPKFLLIPAKDNIDELNGNSGSLVNILNDLFTEVRDQSENYKKAQQYLNSLAKELNPNDQCSEFGKMMGELNTVMKQVFPESGIEADTILSDADKAIKPTFNISMYSNVKTSIELQGTGMIRSAVFGLLRYKSERDQKKLSQGECIRTTIIGFEEPEIYLHPNASVQMRDTIYNLAMNNNNQILCTTHSPYMIDLSKKPNQILNSLSKVIQCIDNSSVNTVKSIPFNMSEAFNALLDLDKDYVKMLLRVDEYISKVFFTKNVLIIEGDTEEIVIKETIRRLPLEKQKEILSDWQIIKARGKATIIPLVKYLKVMGIDPYVMHDKDTGTKGAEKFNNPIRNELGNNSKLWVLENCIEDIIGYNVSTGDKPYKAYKYINDNWNNGWLSVSEKWRKLVEEIWNINKTNDKEESKELVAATLDSN